MLSALRRLIYGKPCSICCVTKQINIVYFLTFHFCVLKVPVSHFAVHCAQRLERIMQTGAKRGVRKPTLEEVEQAVV